MSLNKVLLLGNIGKDPELKQSAKGFSYCFLTVATSHKKKTGEEETEWHNVKLFGKVADLVAKHFKKGNKIFIEGQLKTDEYADKETGAMKRTTSIIAQNIEFPESKQFMSSIQPSQERHVAKQPETAPNSYKQPAFDDDDIPF